MRRYALAWTVLCAATVLVWAFAQVHTATPSGAPAIIAGADISTPTARWALPDALQEISGLAVSDARRVLSHNDELGIVFEIDYGSGRVTRRWTLGSPRIDDDFEGIELVGRRVTLMSSDGRLLSGDIPREGSVIAPLTITDTGLGRRCELEGLAVGRDGAWLLPCKAPSRGRRDGFTIFVRPSADDGQADGEIMVRVQGRRPLHPSAVVETPSGTLVVLFGPERAIGEFSAAGAPIALLALDARRHPQPEGLALAEDGTLLIADEGLRGGGRAGTLTTYGPAR